MTTYVLVLLVGGCVAILAGVALVVLVIRSARRRPARRPVRTNSGPGTVVPAGRVYVSSRAAGAQPARDRVVASPVEEAGATTTYLSYRHGRHRMHAGASR